jgi:hypothetical protein
MGISCTHGIVNCPPCMGKTFKNACPELRQDIANLLIKHVYCSNCKRVVEYRTRTQDQIRKRLAATTDGSTDDELDQLGVWKFGLLIECIYRLDETRGGLSDAAYKERMRRFLDAAHKECERLNRSQEAVDAVYTERLDELLGAAQMAFERLDELKEAENAKAEESRRRAEDESLSSTALPGENTTTEVPHVTGATDKESKVENEKIEDEQSKPEGGAKP